MKRTPLKRTRFFKSGGNSLLRKSDMRKALENGGEISEKQQERLKMLLMFELIWKSLPEGARRCWSCEKSLYEPIRSYYFDHLIEKSKRPDLALERDNIFLCCLECHALKTDGHPTEVHQKAIEKAKERFGIS